MDPFAGFHSRDTERPARQLPLLLKSQTMDVQHILSRKGRSVNTIEPTAPVTAAVKLMAQRRVGALVVTEPDGRIAGIISERDIVRALNDAGPSALSSSVADTMTRKVVTCAETISVVEIMERMTRGKFRHVPVAKRGRLAGIVSINDVVKVRLEQLESKLMKVDEVTASIAHEVRQPLTAIATNSGAALRFLDRKPLDYDEIRRALSSIIDDCHRTSAVFDSIRDLFRTSDHRKQPVNVNEIIQEVLQSLRGDLEDHGITIHYELAHDLPPIEGHRNQLQQVIYNLVHNALEAMDTTASRNRVLSIKTRVVGNRAIRTVVEDSGPGINPEELDRIFDAFVTTKSHGMGLGLAICRMIIERHGGQLTASSDGKSGAAFQFVLPIDR